jgi:hypothetical protein
MFSAIFTYIIYVTDEDPHLKKAFLIGFWINTMCVAFLIPVLIIDYFAEKELKELEYDGLDKTKTKTKTFHPNLKNLDSMKDVLD